MSHSPYLEFFCYVVQRYPRSALECQDRLHLGFIRVSLAALLLGSTVVNFLQCYRRGRVENILGNVAQIIYLRRSLGAFLIVYPSANGAFRDIKLLCNLGNLLLRVSVESREDGGLLFFGVTLATLLWSIGITLSLGLLRFPKKLG